MTIKYIPKAFKIDEFGNFNARISASLELWMAQPAQGQWTRIEQPAHSGDEYRIHLVFTSFDNFHAQRSAFDLSKRTLKMVIAKLREIDGLNEWPSCWDFE